MNNALVKSFGLLVVAAALALTACNSNGSSSTPSNYPSCKAPGNFAGIYPINGSTNVPDGLQTIYVASSVALGSQYQNVIGTGGSYYYGNGFTQVAVTQIPTPRATPGFSNPIYYVTTVNSLSAATNWTMLLNNTNSVNCVPLQYLQFSTQ